MKRQLTFALLAAAQTAVLLAAVPVRWTVETSRVQPAQFEAFHGETLELSAALQSYGKPLVITNNLICIYWQTNDMGSSYWSAPAIISNNVMTARWTPSMDVGANVYSCFIGAPGEIYRATFQLRLRSSPGAVPNDLQLPVKTLDFSQVEVRNPPYYTQGETDAKIIELAPSPGNYETVSNLAMTAVQSDALANMESDPTVQPVLASFASTGTVYRASSLGTPGHWVDATGCVWRASVGGGFNSVYVLGRDVRPVWKDFVGPGVITGFDGPGWYVDRAFGAPALGGVPPVIKLSDDPDVTELSYYACIYDRTLEDPYSYSNLVHATRAHVTNLVGRVALTNDVMSRAETEARFASVDRPYSMIYDPVAGRALTADGRLVDYGRAPRVAGRFIVTPDTSVSSSGFTDGFMPTIALLGGRTNLVEGVDWTSVITPSSSDGTGGYYVSTADITWAQTNAGYNTVGVLPLSAQIVKTVSSFGTSCEISLGSIGYSYYEINVPDVGRGEVSVFETSVSGNTITLNWSFYDYNNLGYYSGTDVFRIDFVDEGGDGVQAVAFGDRGRFATLDDLPDYVEDEVDRKLSDSDTVKSTVRLRTGKSMEYGDGWGRICYEFTGDRRWWELQVPNLTPTVTASSYPFSQSSVDPPSVNRRFVRSEGTNGTERCLASVWDVVVRFGDVDVVLGSVTVTNGIGVTSFSLTMPESGATFWTYSSSYYAYDLRVTSQSGIPGPNPTINLAYSYRNGYSTVYTGYATIRLGTSSNSYTIVEPEYFRVVGTNIQHMFWDEGMKCTWNVAVTNGSFFAEIASTTNLLSSGVSR